MSSVTYRPRAREDLTAIWDYTVGQWNLDQADAYITEIVAACEALARGDRCGRSADEVRPGYRRLAIGSHVIYYRQHATSIEVVRVLHQRMDVSRHALD